MGQSLVGIAILVGFFAIGALLIRDPKPFLAELGRPATDKHIRATRLIGAGFLIVVLLGVLQWLHSLH